MPAVAIFARAVVPGKTKTRLIPELGSEGAAEFHRALVSDVVGKVARLKGKTARYLFTAGGSLPKDMVPRGFECRRQQGHDLAQRLGRAFAELLRHHSRAVIIGTDSPALAPSMLRVALEELRSTDAVLGPCPDGGYYLIGLRRTCRGLFSGLRLGTEFAFRDTLASLLDHGFSISVLEPCPDVDLPQDLAALKKMLIENPTARRLAPHTWRYLSKMV
jgi:rSAM/selenodomain-associated transferase 1